MQLDEAQRKKVGEWVGQGLKLSEIQNRLGAELGLRLTYMEVRMLVDDLKLVPKDVEPPKTASSLANATAPNAGTAPAPAARADSGGAAGLQAEKAPPGTGSVSVTVDQITRPGAVVSGKVTFSDGQRGEWYFDQKGQLALATQQHGYRPPPADLQQFQMALESQLSRMGY